MAKFRVMQKRKINLNIGGKRFVTFKSTLSRYPGTRLSELTDQDPSFDSNQGEHFFDRNSKIFAYILDFYRTGELHFPHSFCGPVIQKELNFWQIPEDNIADCCWKAYKEFEEDQATLSQLERTFNKCEKTTTNVNDEQRKSNEVLDGTGWKYYSRKTWIFLDDPSSSKAAKVWFYFYMLALILSIAIVCMETHSLFRTPAQNPSSKVNTTGVTNPKLLLHLTTKPHTALVIIDTCCALVFCVELITRFIVWPGKVNFFRSFFNVIDLFAVIPYAVNTTVYITEPWFWTEKGLKLTFLFLAVSSVFRCIRILKLVKHSRGLQVMYLAIRASLREILLLLGLIVICTVIFATVIYYAEFANEEDFHNIPVGFWWVVITMTTVGYGDTVPTSTVGYVIGACCALTGMLVTGLPIPVIANSFHLYYTFSRMESQDPSKKTTSVEMSAMNPLCGTSKRLTVRRPRSDDDEPRPVAS